MDLGRSEPNPEWVRLFKTWAGVPVTVYFLPPALLLLDLPLLGLRVRRRRRCGEAKRTSTRPKGKSMTAVRASDVGDEIGRRWSDGGELKSTTMTGRRNGDPDYRRCSLVELCWLG